MGRTKAWEELTICDNFLFQKVMRNPRLCKRLIEKILHIQIKRLFYHETEKSIEESSTQKSVRLDIFVEIEDGTIIDIEMQTADQPLGALPKRTRYYQGMIDLNALSKGKDYIDLNKSFVIFICTFDPFPKNQRKIYTFSNRCHEQYDLELGDETTKIFLSTKGTIGEVDKDIDNFLAYLDGKTAKGKFTEDVAAEVDRVKQHKETRLEYMTLMMKLREQRREGFAEGRIETILKNVRELVAETGWSIDKTLDILKVSPEDRLIIANRL